MTLEETPKTGFNVLLMVEAMAALAVIVAGVVWYAVKLENRVTVLEDQRQQEAKARDTQQRDQRIERIEQSLQEMRKAIPQK